MRRLSVSGWSYANGCVDIEVADDATVEQIAQAASEARFPALCHQCSSYETDEFCPIDVRDGEGNAVALWLRF